MKSAHRETPATRSPLRSLKSGEHGGHLFGKDAARRASTAPMVDRSSLPPGAGDTFNCAGRRLGAVHARIRDSSTPIAKLEPTHGQARRVSLADSNHEHTMLPERRTDSGQRKRPKCSQEPLKHPADILDLCLHLEQLARRRARTSVRSGDASHTLQVSPTLPKEATFKQDGSIAAG
jgi:hypothetical protein